MESGGGGEEGGGKMRPDRLDGRAGRDETVPETPQDAGDKKY